MSWSYKSYPSYTPETHPFRGQTFMGWAPGTFNLDGKPYCPTAWILSQDGGNLSVQNTKEECETLAAKWGAKIEWQNRNSNPFGK